MAVLVAVEEETLGLDDPAGPEGSTVAHLLAHASGLGLDGARIAQAGAKRIYSNAGFEVLGELLAERSKMPVRDLRHRGRPPAPRHDRHPDGAPGLGGRGHRRRPPGRWAGSSSPPGC